MSQGIQMKPAKTLRIKSQPIIWSTHIYTICLAVYLLSCMHLAQNQGTLVISSDFRWFSVISGKHPWNRQKNLPLEFLVGTGLLVWLADSRCNLHCSEVKSQQRDCYSWWKKFAAGMEEPNLESGWWPQCDRSSSIWETEKYRVFNKSEWIWMKYNQPHRTTSALPCQAYQTSTGSS